MGARGERMFNLKGVAQEQMNASEQWLYYTIYCFQVGNVRTTAIYSV